MIYAQPLEKYACGGKMRPSSRKRHIAASALIAGGVQVLGSLFGMSSARKAQKEQARQLKQQELDAINAQYSQAKANDYNTYNNTNTFGDNNVEYYANGGEVEANSLPNSAPNLSPMQMAEIQKSLTQNGGLAPQMPVSNGGYQTKGGNLVPIGDGVEEAVGNQHNEEKIDGVSGIQLSKNGEPVAEIENKEVVVDGDTVFSHQLKYDGKQSYADKMRKITAKRNKLEKEQNTAKDRRIKNTIERKLAGLNMAEEALFTHQEHRKYAEGIKVADSFAFGGKLPKFSNGGNVFTDTNNGKKYRLVNGKKQYFIDFDPIKTAKEEEIKLNTALNKKDVDWNASTLNIQPLATTGAGEVAKAKAVARATAGVVSIPGAGEVANAVGAAKGATTAGTTTAGAAAKGIGSQIGSTALQLAPMLIDNIGNFLLTKNTPKLPTPLLNKVEHLETKVNVNPQLAEIRRTNKAVKDNILFNTSNSNNAKNNLVATALAGNRQANEILGGKENQEIALKNADHQNKQMVANTNNATMNEHKFRQYQRSNDINSQYSANLADLSKDIGNVITSNKLDKQFDANTLANLADDKLGEKAAIYIGNKDFMSKEANRKAMKERADFLSNKGDNYIKNLLISKGYYY